MIDIRVPATSANIGAGFDSLGLSVGLWNTVSMELCDTVDISSRDNTPIPQNENNLIYATVKRAFDICGRKLPGLRLIQENNIPMTRGLGSSSACVVGGLVGANALLGSPFAKDDIVNIAASIEGHPDNSTPALLGGIVTGAIENGKVFYCRQDIPEDLMFLAIIPDFPLETAVARAALPKEVTHKQAVYNLSRAALMAASLVTGKYENLRIASQDMLHQAYRMPFIPGGQETLDAVMEFGAYAGYISGAGSTIMAILPTENSGGITDRMRRMLNERGCENWQLRLLKGDNLGAVIIDN